jgi:hypothetical protein
MKNLSTFISKLYFVLILILISTANIARAAVIYSDVNPDSANALGDQFVLDLDHNGWPDILIFQDHDTTYNFNAVIATGLSFDGGVTYVSQIAQGATYYSKKFSANDVISGANTFTNSSELTFDFYYPSEEWRGVTDGYLGVEFLISGAVHYGWIRLDVASNGIDFTIKDYAYESIANTQILAGAGGGITSTIAVVESANITAFENIISLKEIKNEGTMTVYNSLGTEVFNTKVNEGDSSFTLNNTGTGIYIVNVSVGNSILTKKIYIKI